MLYPPPWSAVCRRPLPSPRRSRTRSQKKRGVLCHVAVTGTLRDAPGEHLFRRRSGYRLCQNHGVAAQRAARLHDHNGPGTKAV